MWMARNAPALSPCFFFQCSRLALTSRMPTVICVGRKSASGVDLKIGSRTIGHLPENATRRQHAGVKPPRGRARPGHPRLETPDESKKDVGARNKSGHGELTSLLLGDGALRIEALDVAALGAGGRVDHRVDQRRLARRERFAHRLRQ